MMDSVSIMLFLDIGMMCPLASNGLNIVSAKLH